MWYVSCGTCHMVLVQPPFIARAFFHCYYTRPPFLVGSLVLTKPYKNNCYSRGRAQRPPHSSLALPRLLLANKAASSPFLSSLSLSLSLSRARARSLSLSRGSVWDPEPSKSGSVIGADRQRFGPSCVLLKRVPQGRTESEGIVLALLAANAGPREPSGGVTLKRRCTYRPSVIYLIVNKLLSLSLSLSRARARAISVREATLRMWDEGSSSS